MAKRKKEQWEIDNALREDALKAFKKNFKRNDPVFATATRKLCITSDCDDEPYIQHVAALLKENKQDFPARLEYLSIMTSEDDLGRTKNHRRVVGGEGRSKLRAVLGLFLGEA